MARTKVQLVSNIVGNVSGGASFTGIVTTSGGFSGNLTGNATGLTGTPNLNVGVVTATSLSLGGNTVSTAGVGIKTAGGTVGTGVTLIDLRGAGISTVTVASGIATVNVSGGGGSQLSISTTAPVGPTDGQLWFDSSNGNTYIWYNSQNVWVVSQTYGY